MKVFEKEKRNLFTELMVFILIAISFINYVTYPLF